MNKLILRMLSSLDPGWEGTVLIDSLIRVMYWIVATILNRPFKPLNIKILQNICTYTCTLTVYTIHSAILKICNVFIKVHIIK